MAEFRSELPLYALPKPAINVRPIGSVADDQATMLCETASANVDE
jgi:hypothetical protein